MTIQDVTDALDLPELRAARQARREFLDRLEPLRAEPVELNGYHY